MALSNITVTTSEANVQVDITNTTVTVAQTISNVTVGTSTFASNADIRSALSNTSPILYNSSTGVIGFDGNASFAGKTTDDLAEGSTNLYWTTARGNAQTLAYTGALPNLTGNVTTTGNITTTANISTTANIAGSYFEGNGSLLSGISATSNADILQFLATSPDAANMSFAGPENTGVGADTELTFRGNVALRNNLTVGTLGVSPNAVNTITVTGNLNQKSGIDSNSNLTQRAFHRMPADGALIFIGGLQPTPSANATQTFFNNNQLLVGGDKLGAGYPYDQWLETDSNIASIKAGGSGPGLVSNQRLFDNRNGIEGVDTINATGDLSLLGNNIYLYGNKGTLRAGSDSHVNAKLHLGNTLTSNANITTTANVNAGVLSVTGNIDSLANINSQGATFTNVITSNSLISTSANVSGTYFIGDGSLLTNLPGGGDVGSVNGQTGVVVLDTDDISEGTTNLYYTSARAKADANTAIGTNTTDNLTEGSTNLYFTNTRADARVNLQTGVNLDLSSKSTTDLSEGTNLYFTNARANTVIGTNTTDNLTEGTTNLYYTSARANTDVVTHIATVPLTVGGNLTVNGNAEISGNLNYRNVTDLYITDQKITLNANATTNADVEIIANRPENTSTMLKWNETSDKWTFTNDGSTYYNIATSTTDLAEGTNLYYTQGRFDTAFGNKSTTDLTEGTNLYFTNARANTVIGTNTTTDLAEGTNLYYTDARSRAAVSVTTATPTGNGSLTYNNTSGVFTFTPADASAGGISLSNLSVTTGSASGNGGLTYSNTTGVFNFTPADVPATTDNLTEGSTNLYYTDARADARVNLQTGTNLDLSSKSTTDLAEGTNLYWTTARGDAQTLAYTGALPNLTGNITTTANASASYFIGDGSQLTNIPHPADAVTSVNTQTGVVVLDTDDIAEGSTNLYWTTARGNTNSDAWLTTKLTTDLAEGTNLYYTDARVQTKVANLTGNVTTTANISGAYILGDGSQLTGLGDHYNDANVISLLGNYANTITTSANIDVSGNLNLGNTTSVIFGTNTTSGQLTIDDTGILNYVTESDVTVQTYSAYRNGSNGTNFDFYKAGGSIASPTAIGPNDYVYREEFFAHDGTQFYPGYGAAYAVFQDTDAGSVGTDDVPLTHEFSVKRTPNTGNPSSVMKLTADRQIIFNDTGVKNYGDYKGTANLSAAGAFHTAGNITSDAFFLGNGSLLSGVTGATDSFGTVAVAGQTNIQASQANALLTLASSGDITLTTAGDTLTIGGSGGTYGNTQVETFLGSNTMTGDIVYQGNMQLSTANVSTAIDSYQGNNTTGSGDRVILASDVGWFNGQYVTFSGTTNAALTFLNGNTYQVGGSGTTWNLYTNYSNFTKLSTATGTEAPTGLAADHRTPGNTTARFYGNTYVMPNSTLHADAFKPATPGAVISFQSVRMQDVGLGSGGTNFFFPETGGNTEGYILTAHSDNVGTWELGLNVTTDNSGPEIITVQNSRNSSVAIEEIYKKSRGTTASPVVLNSGDRIHETEYYGYDGTNYLEGTFGEHVYVDTNSGTIGTGVMPLSKEFYVRPDGILADNRKSVLKLRANRSIEFNANEERSYNSSTGNANITLDGSINSVSTITGLNIKSNQFVQLKNYTTTEINALTGMAAGDTVYNTSLTNVCVYNGSAWRKIVDETM